MEDLVGKRFGRLTVVRLEPTRQHRKRMWLCKCDCGGETIATTGSLNCGKTTSCRCLRYERVASACKVANMIHGKRYTKEYRTWINMKSRCYNPKYENYKDYGAKGVIVCERWLHSFENFFEDMGECPDGYSIDRIDVAGNYSPENCRWATNTEQAYNKRNTIVIEYQGISHNLKEWAEILGVKKSLIYDRLRYGWSFERIYLKESRGILV